LGIFQVYNRIVECSGSDKISMNVSMKEHTSFKVGGNAKLLVTPNSVGEVLHTISVCKNYGVKYFVMGNGTNVLVKDSGYDGVIIKLGEEFNQIEIEGEELLVQAGASLFDAAIVATENELTGMEFASGIPGTIGGAVFMNAGAFDGEMKDIIKSVKFLGNNCKLNELENKDLKLGYRHSMFQSEKFIILEVRLKLQKGNIEEIKNKIEDFRCRREEKQPLDYPSAGSVFKRPEGHYAGKLITDAGLKGLTVGGASVSTQHAGFIINENNATAEDVINLIEIIKQTVYDKFQVKLEQEVRILED